MSSKENLQPLPTHPPTPCSSQSPRKSPVKSRTSSDCDSPLSSPPARTRSLRQSDAPFAPPTPLSTSKRRASLTSPAANTGVSPTKRSKAILPPSTGLPATPGRGNLFPSPSKQRLAEDWIDEEVFGMPQVKAESQNGHRKAGSKGKENVGIRPMIKARRAGKGLGLRNPRITASVVLTD